MRFLRFYGLLGALVWLPQIPAVAQDSFSTNGQTLQGTWIAQVADPGGALALPRDNRVEVPWPMPAEPSVETEAVGQSPTPEDPWKPAGGIGEGSASACG